MRGGMVPQQLGKGFEHTFSLMARTCGLKVIRVPEAGRWIGRGSFKPISGLCDFILIKNGLAAFIDTKTTAGDSFSASSVNPDQLEHLVGVGDMCPAGYVVFFRKTDQVVFYSWSDLMILTPDSSLKPQHGKLLGSIMKFDPTEIFSCYRPDGMSLI